VVGAPFEDSNATGINGNQASDTAFGSGAAYVYGIVAGAWEFLAYLKASNTDINDAFGSSVAISHVVVTPPGDTPVDFEFTSILVGAPGEASNATGFGGDQNDESMPGAGAAYLFTGFGIDGIVGPFDQDEYIKASNTEGGDGFGDAVAMVFGTLVVGAPTEDSDAGGFGGDELNNDALESGAVYIFHRGGDPLQWEQLLYMKAPNADAVATFGSSLGLGGGTLVVGAPLEDSDTVGINGNLSGSGLLDSGAAYSSP
jgi:FG-GAP repeat